MSVAAIVLAAGRGTRFGADPKLLARLAGEPLVRHAVRTAVGSGATPVLVVAGHRAPDVRRALAGLPVAILDNPDFAAGLSTSLRAGFAALPPDAEAAIVLLGDMPAVSAGLAAELIAAWRDAGRPVALVPTFGGQRGNPVVLSRELAPAIGRLTGDAGAGKLLRDLPGVVELAVDDPGVILDVDTPAALAQVSTTDWRMAE